MVRARKAGNRLIHDARVHAGTGGFGALAEQSGLERRQPGAAERGGKGCRRHIQRGGGAHASPHGNIAHDGGVEGRRLWCLGAGDKLAQDAAYVAYPQWRTPASIGRKQSRAIRAKEVALAVVH